MYVLPFSYFSTATSYQACYFDLDFSPDAKKNLLYELASKNASTYY